MKSLVTTFLFCSLTFLTYAQVGIGTITPDASLTVIVDTGNDFAALKAEGRFGPTFGYLGVQGKTNFDGISTADWSGQEIGVVGISVGSASSTDNVGILGHSNYIGIRAENSSGDNTVELATTTLAGNFDGRVEIIGIADATPTANTGGLEINNSLRIDNNEIITNTDTNLLLQWDNNGDLRVDNGTFNVDASTNRVGIGTNAPSTDLDIRSTTTHARITLDGDSAGNTSQITFEEGSVYEGSIGFQHADDYLFMYHGHNTNQNGVMVQDADLAVGLVGGDNFRSNGRIQSRGNIIPYDNNSYDLGNSSYRWDDVYATNGTINTSDRRDKENIQTLNYGLEAVLKLKPVTFKWKDSFQKATKIGFIAQDLKQVLPEVVKTHDVKIITTGNADGSFQETKEIFELERLGVYYSDIIPVLTKAIQEQQEIIEELKKRIELLEKK